MSEADYRAHLATGSTTRALCWRLERGDGVVFGFTDHDEPLTFGGLTYEARAALAGSDLGQSLGLAVDDQDVSGALTSDRITPRDLIRGLYDGARVRVYDVNWQDVAARRLIGDFVIGEVERGEVDFRAELRARVARLTAKAGGRYIPECSARVGDARRGVALASAAFTGSDVVTALTGDGFRASGLGAYPGGWFNRGVLETCARIGYGAEYMRFFANAQCFGRFAGPQRPPVRAARSWRSAPGMRQAAAWIVRLRLRL